MEKVMYGTHAIQIYVTFPNGDVSQIWACGKCRRLWGLNDKHMASGCCCTHMVCKCGGEHSKSWTMCDDCRCKGRLAAYYAKPEKEWDGEFPITISDSDVYFFDESDLLDYIAEMECPPEEIVNELRLSSCHPNKPRYFDINDWCSDDLADDGEVSDARGIDEEINAILQGIGVLSWSSNNDRLNVSQVLKEIGYEIPSGTNQIDFSQDLSTDTDRENPVADNS